MGDRRLRKITAFIMIASLAFGTLWGCGNKEGTAGTKKQDSGMADAGPGDTGAGDNEAAGAGAADDIDPAADGREAGKRNVKLKVAMMPFCGNVPAQYAYDQGYFADEGLEIEFFQFANGAAINEALGARQVDVAVSGLAMVFSLASGTCTWIGESNTSGGMGIYVSPDSPILTAKGEIEGKPELYGSAQTIKGAKVLGQLGTSSQYNVVCWLQQFGLTESDIEFINLDLGTDLTALYAGEGEALAASRPYSFQAEDKGYVCAATFEDATDCTLYDGIVARSDVVKKDRDALVRFLRAYYKAADEIAADEKLRFDTSMKYFSDNGRVYSDADMEDEIRVNAYVTADSMKQDGYVFGEAMIKIADFYSEAGKIETSNLPNVPASFDTSLLKDALGIDVAAASQ